MKAIPMFIFNDHVLFLENCVIVKSFFNSPSFKNLSTLLRSLKQSIINNSFKLCMSLERMKESEREKKRMKKLFYVVYMSLTLLNRIWESWKSWRKMMLKLCCCNRFSLPSQTDKSLACFALHSDRNQQKTATFWIFQFFPVFFFVRLCFFSCSPLKSGWYILHLILNLFFIYKDNLAVST